MGSVELFKARSAGWAAAIALALAGGVARAEEPAGYVVEVHDLTAKVGERAVMVVTARVHDGYRVLHAYNNRIIKLSSYDNGVAFEDKMVKAKAEGSALVFSIPLTATKPGRHPINGLLRVGYIEGEGEFSEVSLPLIANVTGAQ